MANDQDDIAKRLEQIQESMDSMHHRMDRFYSWAGLLQSEFRSMQQRTGFIEGVMQERFDFTQQQRQSLGQPTLTQGVEKGFGSDVDNALWARMERITGKKSES